MGLERDIKKTKIRIMFEEFEERKAFSLFPEIAEKIKKGEKYLGLDTLHQRLHGKPLDLKYQRIQKDTYFSLISKGHTEFYYQCYSIYDTRKRIINNFAGTHSRSTGL